MNLVDLVTSQLTGDVLSKLARQSGIDEAQARPAAVAAVPALLSVLAKLSATSGGAGQVATALRGLDLQSPGSPAAALGGGQGEALGSLGGTLLTSLLGDSYGALAGALGSFLGTRPGAAKAVLSSLAPIVLGTIAGQFSGARADAAGVARLFAEQQGTIAAALPAGLSLAGLDRAAAPRADHAEPTSLMPAWIPLLLLPILGVVGWLLWPQQPPPVPVVVIEEDHERARAAMARSEAAEDEDRAAARQDETPVSAPVERQVEKPAEPAPGVAEALAMAGKIEELFGTLAGILGAVKDEVSAREAIPRVNACKPAVEELQRATAALPAAGKAAVADIVTANIAALEKAVAAVMAIPGVRELVGTDVAPIFEALGKLGK